MLALTLSLGAHWALLQSVAWVGMVAAYSRDGSVAEAFNKTFDGKHPCCLCKVIQAGRAAEKKHQQHQVKPGSKLDVGILGTPLALDFQRERERVAFGNFRAVSRHEEPPKPPPRAIPVDCLA